MQQFMYTVHCTVLKPDIFLGQCVAISKNFYNKTKHFAIPMLYNFRKEECMEGFVGVCYASIPGLARLCKTYFIHIAL